MEGRCQCGLVRFTTPLPAPLKIYICHCTECRHQSSSSYGVTAAFPSFDIPSPGPDAIGIYTRPNSTGQTHGLFCTQCGARLMHRRSGGNGSDAAGGTVSVKGGCLVGLTKEMMRTAVHIWTSEAVVDVPEGVEQYEEEPPR